VAIRFLPITFVKYRRCAFRWLVHGDKSAPRIGWYFGLMQLIN